MRKEKRVKLRGVIAIACICLALGAGLLIGKIWTYNECVTDKEAEIASLSATVSEKEAEIKALSAYIEQNEAKLSFLSDNTYENLELLKSYVDYAIELYCNETGKPNTFQYSLLDDMLHHDLTIKQDKYLKFDLNKEITSDLANDRYIFEVAGGEDILYIVIDTYRMKIYAYEYVKGTTIIRGGDYDKGVSDKDLESIVQSDWDDMWPEEYSTYTLNGWEYLTTPSLDEMKSSNPDLYGMVIYSLQRYCEEKGIEEQFYFDFRTDRVCSVAYRIFTVKVQSENRILYMDIDMDRNKVHIYQVED